MPLPSAISPEQFMPAKSRVTLRMVFELVQSVESRTARLEQNYTRLADDQTRLADNQTRLATSVARLEDGYAQLVVTDNLLLETTKKLVETTNRIDATLLVMDSRLSALEDSLRSINIRLEVLHRHVEHQDVQLGILSDEYHAIVEQLKRLEARFDRWEAAQLETRVTALEQKVV